MKSFFLIAVLFGIVFSHPIEDQEHNISEGDMILTPKQKDLLFKRSKTRNGVTNPALRWPGAVVHYQFTSSIPSSDRNLIAAALSEIEKVTCIRFEEGSNAKNHYVRITNIPADGCYSYVGYLPGMSPGQQLNLGRGCMYKGIIMHEFLHALGFFHQQSSADRDSYVTIHLENVEAGQEHNFDKYSSAEVTNFGIEYDPGSIMHYGAYDFSKNGKPVITSKTIGADKMGQRNGLSDSDITKINRMYNCKL